jgi:Uma2 family endonuclease
MISVEDYLATSYESDCDYLDGEVVERNWGDQDHSSLQAAICSHFFVRRKEWNILALMEQRVRIKRTRFRVPDICLTLGFPDEQILTKPPFLCIEILSPEDRMTRIIQRIDDYLEMGVAYVWVLDPKLKLAYTATAAEGLRELKNTVLRTENPTLEVPLNEIFA